MKRIIGIVLIIVGVALAVVAFNRHDEDRTIIDLGKVEIKTQDQAPSENTTLYYVLAAVCVIGGGFLVAGKRGSHLSLPFVKAARNDSNYKDSLGIWGRNRLFFRPFFLLLLNRLRSRTKKALPNRQSLVWEGKKNPVIYLLPERSRQGMPGILAQSYAF
ncbi:MAG: hypothetical protein IPH31_12560 [Lewinellaceae bacterium]|nr:hypothetical protein [Lewinellaceae bacterium]